MIQQRTGFIKMLNQSKKPLTFDEIGVIEALAAKRHTTQITNAIESLYSLDIPKFIQDLNVLYLDRLELARISELHEINPTTQSNLTCRMFGAIDALTVIHNEFKKGGVNRG